MTLTPAELDALTVRYLELNSHAEDITGQLEGIKARLRDAYPDGFNGTAPCGAKVSVTLSRRFDAAMAEKVLTAEQLVAVTVAKVDAATAKQILAPALYEACSPVSGKPTVRIS